MRPLNEFDFYNEYRRRLQAKLDEKNKQIAREEHLLVTDADQGDSSLQVSLHHAIRERNELELLLKQIREQLGKSAASE